MTPARTEAAARAMLAAHDWTDGEITGWDAMPLDWQGAYLVMAEAALAAAFPELASGTHWLAPVEATPDMCQAMSFGERGQVGPAGMWLDAREAYLKDHP